jgi:hypothetical protein
MWRERGKVKRRAVIVKKIAPHNSVGQSLLQAV